VQQHAQAAQQSARFMQYDCDEACEPSAAYATPANPRTKAMMNVLTDFIVVSPIQEKSAY